MTEKRRRVAENETQQARRKKRHREVMRNRILFGLGCLAVLVLIIFLIVKLVSAIFGAGGSAEESTLTFLSSGKVVYEEVEDFDQDTYSKSDLKKYTNDLIDSFNETAGEDAISLDEFKVKGDKAYIKTTYSSAENYETFTSYTTYLDSVDKAIEAGYTFEDVFYTVTDGAKGEATDATSGYDFSGYQVAIVKENTIVVVPGTINFVSGHSSEVVDENTVKISPADGNEDSQELVYIIFTSEDE